LKVDVFDNVEELTMDSFLINALLVSRRLLAKTGELIGLANARTKDVQQGIRGALDQHASNL
jgi:hypothetical protein